MEPKDEKWTIIDIRSEEERQIEKDVDKSLGEVADGLVRELIQINKTRKFIQPGHVVDKRTYSIGELLDRMGGLRLMQAAYFRVDRFSKKNKRNVRLLEYAWDGIGDWQA